MTKSLRNYNLQLTGTVTLTTEICCNCHVLFAMTEEQVDKLRATPGTTFYCPNGHAQHYTGKSAEQRLKEAQARETALQDQLRAAIREGDNARTEVLRIRQRIANGVCPCCTRSFPNVLAHMASKHPDYALPANVRHATDVEFRCSCGHTFPTYQGLRIHQGRQRREDGPFQWDKPDQDRWWSHLTVV